jgi:secondary thiamine-phosphate synthase enzyme
MMDLSPIHRTPVEQIVTAVLSVETIGEGFFEITREVAGFLKRIDARDGALFLYLRHTSASLVIQENADPDVLRDLEAFLERLAPEAPGRYAHDDEGPDDMPAHLRAALTAVQLSVPVTGGRLALGTWQAIYLFEHRRAPHRREVVGHLMGE